MRSSDLQREENYNEYLRLLQNDDYVDVTFDEQSGGMSAVHTKHKFAKQKGAYGIRQGDYERIVLDVLRKRGHRVLLGAETNTPGIKSFDGFLDDVPMEIKAIEGKGTWTISTKLRQAEEQNAQCVVMYFPEDDLFSPSRISEGVRLFSSRPDCNQGSSLTRLVAIVQDKVVVDWHKKATPIEGWSVWEGLRR